jgi:hypothetical protein
MNSTLTLKIYSADTTTATAVKPTAVKPESRFLTCKWDMLAVLGLMASSAVYGVYALTQMTGF